MQKLSWIHWPSQKSTKNVSKSLRVQCSQRGKNGHVVEYKGILRLRWWLYLPPNQRRLVRVFASSECRRAKNTFNGRVRREWSSAIPRRLEGTQEWWALLQCVPQANTLREVLVFPVEPPGRPKKSRSFIPGDQCVKNLQAREQSAKGTEPTIVNREHSGNGYPQHFLERIEKQILQPKAANSKVFTATSGIPYV